MSYMEMYFALKVWAGLVGIGFMVLVIMFALGASWFNRRG